MGMIFLGDGLRKSRLVAPFGVCVYTSGLRPPREGTVTVPTV